MIGFERKKINNKPFYYLTDQVKVGKKFKKIQVFVGKNIPKDTGKFYSALRDKETKLLKEQIRVYQFASKHIDDIIVQKVEQSRIDWKYFVAQLSTSKYERLMRDFAIHFIFESNAIEGSKLSQSEVSAIIKKQYVKKSIPKREIQEVMNSIEAFEYIRTNTFKLNQKSIKILHSIVTNKLGVPQGFKKQQIIVNNKETIDPKNVREELTKLIVWYRESKTTEHPFVRAVIFHNRFEHIHPFTDGNGRTGRLLFNWMLLQEGYGFILFINRNRTAYMDALSKGDEGRYRNILKLSVNTYRRTVNYLAAS